MTSLYLDASNGVADAVRCLSDGGIKAVGRYYNYGAGDKVLTRREAQALIAENISIWVVFQYWGNKPKWFSADFGGKDAIRALQCAQEIVGQPVGTAIYFAVDYDETGEHYPSNIVPYFKAVRDAFARNDGSMPYRIGVYGNGLVCRRLLDDGLVTESWLSCSRGHAEHAVFYASNRWTLSQTCGVPDVCGCQVESDEVNPERTEFGQFGHLTALVRSHRAPAAAELLAEFIANANAADAVDSDPAKPHLGEESELGDHETARLLTNVGAGIGTALPRRIRSAKSPRSTATTVDIDITVALSFLEACIDAKPRVTYRLGAKVPFPGAVPGADFGQVDCSGFVREAISRAERAQLGFPDGSVVQHDWVRAQGFARVDTASGQEEDGLVRMAFLRPQDTHSRIGHVALIHNGKTLESHSGVGPDSLPWIEAGWQALAYVYLLTRADRGRTRRA
jgi:cell wall-associated NlpC family hydrolase